MGKRASRGLTQLQIETLTYLSEGYTHAEIGELMNLSKSSVNGHLNRVYITFGCRSGPGAACQAVAIAFKRGILT